MGAVHDEAEVYVDIICSGVSQVTGTRGNESADQFIGSLDDVHVQGHDEDLFDIDIEGIHRGEVEIENEVNVEDMDSETECTMEKQQEGIGNDIKDEYYDFEEDEGIYVQFLESRGSDI